jgi:hypothetical protein
MEIHVFSNKLFNCFIYFLTTKIPPNSLLKPSEEGLFKKLDSAFTRGSQRKL